MIPIPKKVELFICSLSALAYDGNSMKQIDAAGMLDMAMSANTPTLLYSIHLSSFVCFVVPSSPPVHPVHSVHPSVTIPRPLATG
jgi:hypothetical protein